MQPETADFASDAATWRTGQNTCVVFDSVLEVHNVSHQRQKSEPWPQQVTEAENLVKFGRVVFEIRKRTDRQTNKQKGRHTDTLLTILRTK